MSETFTAIVHVESDGENNADTDLLELAFGHGMDDALHRHVEGFAGTCSEQTEYAVPGTLTVTLNPDNGVDYTQWANREGMEADVRHAMQVGLAKHADFGTWTEAHINPAEVCDHPEGEHERANAEVGGRSWIQCGKCGCPLGDA